MPACLPQNFKNLAPRNHSLTFWGLNRIEYIFKYMKNEILKYAHIKGKIRQKQDDKQFLCIKQ